VIFPDATSPRAAGKEDDVRPGPDLQRPQIQSGDTARVRLPAAAEDLLLLGEEQRRVIAALRSRPHGMTLRQLESRLRWPRGAAEQALDGLLQRQLVARLNTVIPSYMYRYGGVDVDSD
jgi:hypothetical protein